MKRTAITLTLLAGIAATGTAFAASHASEAAMAAVKARQSHMQLYAFNLGVLGGMAKGAIDYDVDMATAAAGNIAALSKLDQSRYWMPGTSTEELGDATEALPKIWEGGSDVGTKAKALVEAAAAMDGAAGQGLDALRAAMGPLGDSCGSCHKAYRKPD